MGSQTPLRMNLGCVLQVFSLYGAFPPGWEGFCGASLGRAGLLLTAGVCASQGMPRLRAVGRCAEKKFPLSATSGRSARSGSKVWRNWKWKVRRWPGVNKVILVGNLGQDPEVRTSQDGTKIVNFTLATSETWNDRARRAQGKDRVAPRGDLQREPSPMWPSNICKRREGLCRGRSQTRKWTDQSGQEKYTTEVVISRFRGDLQLIDSRAEGDAGGAGEGGGGYQPRERAPARAPPPAARRAAGRRRGMRRGQ